MAAIGRPSTARDLFMCTVVEIGLRASSSSFSSGLARDNHTARKRNDQMFESSGRIGTMEPLTIIFLSLAHSRLSALHKPTMDTD
jgi:hypothetical protein